MFDELNAILGLSDHELPHQHFISLVDCASDLTCDASIFLHHFLHLYLKAGHRVVLLGLNQPFLHYKTICQRRALNLTRYRDSGHLLFIEGMKEVACLFREKNKSGGDFSFVRDGPHTTGCTLLKPLFCRIRSLVETLPLEPVGRVLVMVDSLSLLLDVGVGVGHVLAFSHHLYHLCVSDHHQHHLTYLPLVRGAAIPQPHARGNPDIYTGLDEASTSLLTTLSHQSELELHVQALTTGFSREVHGLLLVRKQEEGRKKDVMMHFKVEERNVRFFPVGTSSAVL